CFAGCTVTAICNSIGIRPSDLFLTGPVVPGRSRREIARYFYRDEQGKELFQTIRYEPKRFSQGHVGPDGNWISNIQGVRRVLYKLPELLNDIAQGRSVLFVEGEKDVETLRTRGFAATTNPMGASKWRVEYSGTFKGATVYILPDNDAPGRE